MAKFLLLLPLFFLRVLLNIGMRLIFVGGGKECFSGIRYMYKGIVAVPKKYYGD